MSIDAGLQIFYLKWSLHTFFNQPKSIDKNRANVSLQTWKTRILNFPILLTFYGLKKLYTVSSSSSEDYWIFNINRWKGLKITKDVQYKMHLWRVSISYGFRSHRGRSWCIFGCSNALGRKYFVSVYSLSFVKFNYDVILDWIRR